MLSAKLRDGLELRPLEEQHAGEVFAAVDRDREYLRQWLPWVDGTRSADDSRAFIRTSLEASSRNEGFVAGLWVEGEFAGTVGTLPIDWQNRRVEVGYWLAEGLQRRGIMTEACGAVVRHLLLELQLHRVEIQCAVGNDRSRGIPVRLGFTLEGLRRQAIRLNGVYHDAEMWALLADGAA